MYLPWGPWQILILLPTLYLKLVPQTLWSGTCFIQWWCIDPFKWMADKCSFSSISIYHITSENTEKLPHRNSDQPKVFIIKKETHHWGVSVGIEHTEQQFSKSETVGHVSAVLSCFSRVQLFCYSMDCSPPGSSVHGILQARILEWVAMPSSRGSSQPRDQTQFSHTVGGFFIVWATREARAMRVPGGEASQTEGTAISKALRKHTWHVPGTESTLRMKQTHRVCGRREQGGGGDRSDGACQPSWRLGFLLSDLNNQENFARSWDIICHLSSKDHIGGNVGKRF